AWHGGSTGLRGIAQAPASGSGPGASGRLSGACRGVRRGSGNVPRREGGRPLACEGHSPRIPAGNGLPQPTRKAEGRTAGARGQEPPVGKGGAGLGRQERGEQAAASG